MTCRRPLPRLVLLASFAAACSSPVETPPPIFTDTVPFVVSNPVAVGTGGGNVVQGSSGQVAFVSLPPGTVPGGTAVSIRVHRTGAVVSAALVDGGLDPVAVPAVAGDTISLTVTGPAGPSLYVSTVPPRRPPVIVRTRPPKHKRDVPVNLVIQVVFSEPIDVASLTPQNFVLRSGSSPVAGQLTFENPEQTIVELIPDQDLAAAAEYELVLRPGISDLDGDTLEAETSIPFTTATVLTRVTQLAFVRDSQIYMINSDGTGLTRLTNTGPGVSHRDLAWSPDGQRLAFARGRGGVWGRWDIHVMNADGSNVIQLTSGGYNLEPAWSPDGHTIAFTSFVNGSPGGSLGISVIDADRGQGSRVLLDRPGYDADPAWAPEGQRVTFTSDWRFYDLLLELWVMNADGSDPRVLLEAIPVTIAGIGEVVPWTHYFGSTWSPDGQQIAVVVVVDLPVGDPFAQPPQFKRTQELVVANADGSGVRVIAGAGTPGAPTWAPDGNMIAFGSSRCPGSPPCIRFVRADGSAEGLIVTNGHSPAWRPHE